MTTDLPPPVLTPMLTCRLLSLPEAHVTLSMSSSLGINVDLGGGTFSQAESILLMALSHLDMAGPMQQDSTLLTTVKNSHHDGYPVYVARIIVSSSPPDYPTTNIIATDPNQLMMLRGLIQRGLAFLSRELLAARLRKYTTGSGV